VVAVEDHEGWGDAVAELCAFLDVRVLRLNPGDDLAEVLRRERPMAVIAGMDGAEQDGCHVLKLVGGHDPDLPIMLTGGTDPVLRGAAEAVRDVWELTGTVVIADLPSAGEIMDFLSRAGRQGHCLGLMPV
jgi:DNA-binding NtrC family response regulator